MQPLIKTCINTNIKILIVLASVFLLFGCGNSDPKFINEGVIEYNAVPLDENHPFAAMAPGTLSLKFKDNIMCAEMSTMGLFNTRFIANQENKTMTQMVRFVQDKLAHVHDEKEIAAENDSYHYKFTKTKETKKICGYLCKR